MSEPESVILEIVVAPGVGSEAVLTFLDILSDAFRACGGKGGLVVEPYEESA